MFRIIDTNAQITRHANDSLQESLFISQLLTCLELRYLYSRYKNREQQSECDENIFFYSPQWIRPQKKVYEYMHVDCSICMRSTHHRDIARQHNFMHPEVCETCLRKVVACPFCRASLKKVIFKIRRPPSLYPYPFSESSLTLF